MGDKLRYQVTESERFIGEKVIRFDQTQYPAPTLAEIIDAVGKDLPGFAELRLDQKTKALLDHVRVYQRGDAWEIVVKH